MFTIGIFICLLLGYLYVYNWDIYMFNIRIFICLLLGYLYVYYLDIYMFTIRIFICTFDNCEIMIVVNEQNRYLNVWIFKYIVKL